MKNKIKKIIKGDLISIVDAIMLILVGTSLILNPEDVSVKSNILVGAILVMNGCTSFLRWLNKDDVKETKVVEPVLVKKERPKKEKDFDGGDDFRTFKAENGIVD